MIKVAIAKMDGANVCDGHIAQLTEAVALGHPEVVRRMREQRRDYSKLHVKYRDLRANRREYKLAELELVKRMSVWQFIKWRAHNNLEGKEK